MQDLLLKPLILPFRSFLDELQRFAGFRKIPRELQRLLNHLLRPAQVTLAGKNQAPVQVRPRVLGRILNSFLEESYSFGVASQLGIERPQVTLGIGILGTHLNRFLKRGLGFRNVPLLHIYGTQRLRGGLEWRG